MMISPRLNPWFFCRVDHLSVVQDVRLEHEESLQPAVSCTDPYFNLRMRMDSASPPSLYACVSPLQPDFGRNGYTILGVVAQKSNDILCGRVYDSDEFLKRRAGQQVIIVCLGELYPFLPPGSSFLTLF
ncbi:MAG: hypothetical protein PHG00_08385 [Methylococcales bacterium]|nr:hypothetical protein [Methylococcales bacterium]